jgi:hypothetical protein
MMMGGAATCGMDEESRCVEPDLNVCRNYCASPLPCLVSYVLLAGRLAVLHVVRPNGAGKPNPELRCGLGEYNNSK